MTAPRLPQVVVYVLGGDCPLCDRAVASLEIVASEIPLEWTIRVIDHDPRLAVRYGLRVPVVEIDGEEALEGRIDPSALRAALAPRPSTGGAPSRGGENAVPRASSSGSGPSRRSPGSRSPKARTPADRLSDALGLGPAPAEMSDAPATSPRTPKRAYPRRAKATPSPATDASTEAPTDAPDRGQATASVPVPTPEPQAAPVAAVAPAPAPLRPAPAPAPKAAPPPPKPVADPRPTGEMVSIPAGSFLAGKGKRPRTLGAFRIDRDPVSHADYQRFVAATGHRPPLYWRAGSCPAELLDHPVVGVDYADAVAYARWMGKDLPTEEEWERAARGTDGRAYPWGDDLDSCANTARIGLRMTVPIGFHKRNVSPDGCRDMVGNVWEWTHTAAPQNGVVVRGGSWFDYAAYAKTHFRFAARPDVRNGTIGFRCVVREGVVETSEPALPWSVLDVEIAARKGTGPVVDDSGWSAESRDLVPDLPRLRAIAAEKRADEEDALPTEPRRPAVKKAFAPASDAAPESAELRPTPRLVKPAPPAPPRPLASSLPAAPVAPVTPVAPAASAHLAPLPAPAPTPCPARVESEPTVAKAPPTPDVAPPPPVVVAPAAATTPPPAAKRLWGEQAYAVPPLPDFLATPPPAGPPPAKFAIEAPAPVRPAPAPKPPAPPLQPASVYASVPPPPAPVDAPRFAPPVPPLQPASVYAPVPAAKAPSRVPAVVFGIGVIAVCVGAGLLITGLDSGGEAPSAEAPSSPVPPPVASLAGDASPPRVVDGAAPGSALLGTAPQTIVVFARADTASGRDTALLALDLHRRLRTWDRHVDVVLVVPRDSVATPDDPATVGEALAKAGLAGDVRVYLDPADAAGPGRERRGRFRAGEGSSALLLRDGVEVLRARSGDQPLTLARVTPLVVEATRTSNSR